VRKRGAAARGAGEEEILRDGEKFERERG
jgi:hypothetical protein